MFLHAYFDESERESGDFCVAGYGFVPKQAKNFIREWRKMLGPIKCFHTTDLVNRREEFQGFSVDDVNRMMKRAIGIINERVSVAAVVICNRKEFEAVAPASRGFSDPYPVCCHLCMSLMGQWLDKRSPNQGNISYFFEAGNKHYGEADDLINLAATPDGIEAGLSRFYRYRSHTFLRKDAEGSAPLQAADLLAWEWTKVKDETLDRGLRRPRRSLLALLNGKRENFLERHLTGTPLKIYCEQMAGFDLLNRRAKSGSA